MRFRVLAIVVPTLWLPTCLAQGPSSSMNGPAESSKTTRLPDRPEPRPPIKSAWLCWTCLHPKRERRYHSVQPSTWGCPEHVVDWKFSLVAEATIGTSLLVAAGAYHCRQTVGVGRCIGNDGPFKATQGIQIGLSGIMTGIGYWWKKSDQETHERHRQWWVFPVTAATVNTSMAVNQFSKHCRDGTLFNGRTCK
jgi:hypothetical protein